jgi:catechol 2,3-dioxygenase-like lactoylglutathione lyase family enzyme
MRFSVDRLDHLVINCADVETSASWYQRVLGMERETFGRDNRTALRFGGQKLNLRPHDADSGAWHTGASTAPGSQDLCFIATVSAEEIAKHLTGCGISIVEGPVQKHGALGLMKSVYCRDPDGNLIEISTYGD